MYQKILLAFLLLFQIGCSQEQPSTQNKQIAPKPSQQRVDSTTEVKRAANHILVFFINPEGGPCRMQGEILSSMASELKDKVIIRPAKTTVKTDLDLFYTYGIRALPTLLLADTNGREIKRLPPGVHQADSIRSLLSSIPVQANR